MKRFYSIILALCVYICTFAQSQIIRNGDYDHDGQITIADVAKHIDTYIVGFSDSLALKLIWVHDTLYIEKEVIKLDTIYQKETITQHDTIYLYNTEFVHDTLYQDHDIYIHDTTYIDKYNTIYDTVYVDNYITVHDTVYVDSQTTYCIEGTEYPIPHKVDLGLPSGTLWATMNLGAYSNSDYGLKFKWAEILPSEDSNNYKWEKKSYYYTDVPGCESVYHSIHNEDDAAYVYLGEGWNIPDSNQCNELYYNCTITEKGDGTYLFTSKINGNSVVLPIDCYWVNNWGYNTWCTGLVQYWELTKITKFDDTIYGHNSPLRLRPVYKQPK